MLKITCSELAGTVVRPDQFPEVKAVDVVLVGRSNVGKSSLINKLINRKNLARTSSAPGKTRTINFYLINKEWYFVDLPGYGYAKVSKSERESFLKMIDRYFDTSRPRLVWQLVDLRHEPTALDIQMHEYLTKKGLPHLIIGTKADKLSNNGVAKSKAAAQKILKIKAEDLVVFSAESGLNKDVLLAKIDTVLKG